MILFVTRKYPPSVGGMQKLSYELTSAIGQRAASHVISWGGDQPLLPLFLTKATFQSLAMLKTANVRLVHVGDPVLAPLGVLLRRVGDVPVVADAHGLDVTYSNPLYQAVVLPCLRRLDRVICISSYTKRECVRRGVPAANCVVIPPGIHGRGYRTSLREDERAQWLDSWGVDPSRRHILLTVGRLVPRKGLVPFVSESLPLLLDERDDWVHIIIGDGTEHRQIASAIEKHKLSHHVKLLGKVAEQTLRAAYAMTDVFVMPNVPVHSDPEGFGLVTLEARAAGAPVVAARLEGIVDALSGGKDGTLVEPGDWEAFMVAIQEWLRQDECVAARLQRQQRTEANFSWPRIASQYLEVFQGLADIEHLVHR